MARPSGSVGRKDAASKGRLRIERQQDVALSHSKEDVPTRLLVRSRSTRELPCRIARSVQILAVECGLDNGLDLRRDCAVHLGFTMGS